MKRELLATIVAAVFTVPVVAAPFEKDSEVRLKANVPLKFQEQEYRQGKAGEVFTVLQYNPATKAVYVLGTDGSGKPVALNLPEDAVELAPFDIGRLAAKVQQFRANGHLDQALATVDQSIRAGRKEPQVAAFRVALARAQSAAAQLETANRAAEAAGQRVQQMRKNAQVAQSPNRLNRNDNSGAARAQDILRQADELSEAAAKDTGIAQAALDDANAALEKLIADCTGKATPPGLFRIDKAPPTSRRLGATPEQLEARYGKSQQEIATAPFTMRKYRAKAFGWAIVAYEHGRSVAILYTRNGEATTQEDYFALIREITSCKNPEQVLSKDRNLVALFPWFVRTPEMTVGFNGQLGFIGCYDDPKKMDQVLKAFQASEFKGL